MRSKWFCGLCLVVLVGCSNEVDPGGADSCGVSGVVDECECSTGEVGRRFCLDSGAWSACTCGSTGRDSGLDSSTVTDTGTLDLGFQDTATANDTSSSPDTQVAVDTGSATDTGSGTDTSVADTSNEDTGTADTGNVGDDVTADTTVADTSTTADTGTDTVDMTEEPCDDAVCIQSDQMCQLKEGGDDFNLCVDIAVLAGTCDSASRFSADVRPTEGPLIARVVYTRDATRDAECRILDGLAESTAHTITFDYSDAEGDAYSAMSALAYGATLWSREGNGPHSGTLALDYREGSDGTTGTVSLPVCFNSPPSEVAVRISDSNANLSNVNCGTLLE